MPAPAIGTGRIARSGNQAAGASTCQIPATADCARRRASPDVPAQRLPDAEAVVTTTFAEEDGRTALAMLVQHATREHRDAHINSGMEDGMQESMDHLEQVAISLR